MKTKGISLIVLVITILVLSILAATVVISLSNTNIIGQAKSAVESSNLKQYEQLANVAYADWMLDNPGEELTDVSQLEGHGFTVPDGYSATIENGHVVITDGSAPVVAKWSGNIATGFAGGTGTEADPYLISNGEELAYLASSTNSGANRTRDYAYTNTYFKLTANIDLNNNLWTPIGYDGYYFAGNFDGDNHVISNINVDVSDFAGLFGKVCPGIGYDFNAIKNLTVSGGKVSGTLAATIASQIGEDGGSSTILENVHSKNVTINGNGYAYAGGIVSCCYQQSEIRNCSNESLVKSLRVAGGICGFWMDYCDACIINCINKGSVRGTVVADPIIGEWAFDEPDYTKLSNNSNTGTVTGGTVTNNAGV